MTHMLKLRLSELPPLPYEFGWAFNSEAGTAQLVGTKDRYDDTVLGTIVKTSSGVLVVRAFRSQRYDTIEEAVLVLTTKYKLGLFDDEDERQVL